MKDRIVFHPGEKTPEKPKTRQRDRQRERWGERERGEIDRAGLAERAS